MMFRFAYANVRLAKQLILPKLTESTKPIELIDLVSQQER